MQIDMLLVLNHALSARKPAEQKPQQESEPVIDNTYYKRLIVKSPCFAVKAAERPGGKRLFACGTQLGQIYIGDAEREPTESQERLYFYRSRYFDSTFDLQNEKQNLRILLPEGTPLT